MENYTVRHDEKRQHFEIFIEGCVAYIEYELKDKSMDITHTFVPKPLEGRGLAAALTEGALEYAREEGLTVIPTCPYTKAYIERHARYQDLLRP